MVRFFIFLLGMLTTSRAGSPRFTSVRDQDSSSTRELPSPSGPQPYGARAALVRTAVRRLLSDIAARSGGPPG
jgi:hypothetical protein